MATAHSAEERPRPTGAAPTLGFVLAGVALAASFLPWTGRPPLLGLGAAAGSTVAAALALVATVTFALRRYGLLDRRPASAVAGLGALGVTLVAGYRVVAPAMGGHGSPAIDWALPVAAVAAALAAVVSIADWLAMPNDAVWTRVRGYVGATALGLFAFVGILVGQLLALPLLPMDAAWKYAVTMVLSYLGLIAFAVLYVTLRRGGLSYFDLSWPSLRDVAMVLVGFLGLLALLIGVTQLFQQLGVPSSQPQLLEQADKYPELALYLAVLSLVIVGPAEELVYRNVVQKYLYDVFSPYAAIVAASTVFASVHVWQYADADPLATLNTLAVIFVLALVLGYTYYRSDNLVVPIAIHGSFNAMQFLVLYLQLTGRVPGQ
ncbi:MAG: lysostaphin resistance A-like protein [Haloarculaceae archaeon]